MQQAAFLRLQSRGPAPSAQRAASPHELLIEDLLGGAMQSRHLPLLQWCCMVAAVRAILRRLLHAQHALCLWPTCFEAAFLHRNTSCCTSIKPHHPLVTCHLRHACVTSAL